MPERASKTPFASEDAHSRIVKAGIAVLRPTFPLREWAILILFTLLTLIMLSPLSTHLSSMVPEPTDPLLNVWRMQWNAHAFLSGPEGVANLFNTNIFYPFPLSLAYSEHFLMITAQALPFLLIVVSHLVGMNLSVLITFVLSGYAMYLLVADWTGYRWAGLIAGILFAFSPHRFGQLNHLELLVTQWMPFTLLALHWTLTRPGLRYPMLFALFFNLQALSGFHFSFNLAFACALLTLVYLLTRRVYWRRGLWLAAALSMIATLLINWPVWRMYLRFSDVMGAIRTPGEVRIYSAALTDYFTTIPHNFLYGKILKTFGRWQPAGHQFQPLMPVGVVGFFLALFSLISRLLPRPSPPAPRPSPLAFPTTLFLILLTLLSLLLSFGLNEEALGPSLAPLLKFSPYLWLYENVAFFQGIRVPGRYGILVVVGLAGLAGWGVTDMSRITYHVSRFTHHAAKGTQASRFTHHASRLTFLILTPLILLESWSAPLIGPEFPAGQNIAPVYRWLQNETSPDTIVLELPFQGPSEFIYEYYSSYHWRRLADGGTGFTPPIYKDLRLWFNAFPDPRSVDIIQQMGINLVILHPDSYPPEAWQRVLTDLPLYLPAIEQINQIGDDLVLRIAQPSCQAESSLVTATFAPTALDGLPHAVAVSYHNTGPAAFVADVQQVSHLTFAGGVNKNFTEPLVTPANETQSVIIPLRDGQQPAGAWLATLNRTISVDSPPLSQQTGEEGEKQWQPLGLHFSEGPQLVAYSLNPENPTACRILTVALKWEGGVSGDAAVVQLLDPFGRVVVENTTHPWNEDGEGSPDTRTLALVGSLPAGRYGLRVLVRTNDGTERLPVTEDGVTIPTDQIPPLPVVIHPAPRSPTTNPFPTPPLFGDTISLLARELPKQPVAASDWLRFSLVWQAKHPLDTELTVFTQLLGPDGQVWGQRDHQPGGGWYGVSLWRPGQPVVDDYAFQISPDAPPGVYRLIAGLYHPDTLERLPQQNGTDFVEIGTVVVE
jgi:hypothetical protein